MDRDLFLNAGLQFEPSSQAHWSQMPTRPNWDNSDQFDSNSTVSNDIVGKLGGHFSAAAMAAPPPYSITNSQLNSPNMDHFVNENLPRIRNSMPLNPNLQLLAADPGFAERAAKFSCFGSRSFNGKTDQFESNASPVTAAGKFPRISSSPAMKTDRSPVNSNEESSVSEQVPSREFGLTNPKRKRGSAEKKAEEHSDESKRPKKTEQEDAKPPEPPKDYIHVRARRGQATDSHSLAERVRREKISERMELLQNLVPNCNKVTGKALMLDEIINYVQSLQRQVEFLSMKLATVDFATNDSMSQNINPSNGNLCQETSTYYEQGVFSEPAPMTGLTQSVHEFTEHFRGFGQDDLQSIVRMGFNQHVDLDTSFLHMTVDQPSSMKPEL